MKRILTPHKNEAHFVEAMAAASGRKIEAHALESRDSLRKLLGEAREIPRDPTAEEASLYYLRYGVWEQNMPDGFFDGGRGTQFTVDDDGTIVDFASSGETRPLYIVDVTTDENLARFLGSTSRIMSRVSDPEGKALVLAQCVSNLLGGIMEEDAEVRRDAEVARLLEDNPSRQVKLGDVAMGTCVPRSLMYKYFADRLGVRCRLVRGFAKGGPHAWPEVDVGRGWLKVEMTGDMSTFIGPNDPEWNDYRTENNT